MTGWREVVRARAVDAGGELPDAVVDELAEHLEDLEAAARRSGASATEARRLAMAALAESTLTPLRRYARRDAVARRAAQTDVLSRASRAQRTRSLSMLDALRIALHQLRQHPRFAVLTVLVMGLAVGAATTVFTVVDSVLLRPLPFAAPDRLVALWDANAEQGLAREPLSPVTFMDVRDLPAFADAAAWWRPAVNLVDPGLEPLRVPTIETSANLFEVLGVRPQIGAGFPAEDELFSSELVAVISDRLWRTRYGGDPGVVGRPLSLNGTDYTVVGVMPAGFRFPDDVDVWQRLRWDLTQHSRHAHFMEGVARLAPGTTLEGARATADSLALRLGDEHPDSNRGWTTRVLPLLDDQLGYYRPALLVLFGAVGLLLVIGVLNVASLLVTRAVAREREMAVRVSLGASPRQLFGQLLAESLVLSTAGAAVGLAASAAGLPLLQRFVRADVPRLEAATVDVRALALCLAVTAVVTLVLGLAPAHVLLRDAIAGGLRSGERGSSRRSRRLYSGLVAGEVALACALLVGSALLVRTVRQMMETPMGVDAEDVLTASIQLSRSDFDPSLPLPEQWALLAEAHVRILDEVRRQPGVEAAGAANFLPLDEGWRVPFAIEGEPPPASSDDAPQVQIQSISDGYLAAMGARIAAGRDLAPTDGADAPPVVVVNETFVRRHLAERPAVGRSLRLWVNGIGPLGFNLKAGDRHEGTAFEVVGVVADVRNVPFGQSVEPAIYFTARQFPFAELSLAVRASDRATAVAALRRAVASAMPTVPVGTPETWGERLAARTAEPRLLMTVLTLFGVLAGVLAAAGVYGLVSWSVAMRRRELAIRLVLGASPAGVGGLVLRQSAILVALGLVAGVAIVRLAGSALAAVLYQVRPGDPAATAGAAAVLVAAAAVACAPAIRRAMRVAPAEGLRTE